MLSIEKIVSLCKQRGIVFPGSEIYGGLANSWDYGPIGVESKKQLSKNLWWKNFVTAQYRKNCLRWVFSSEISTLSCSIVSLSRTVTLLSSKDSKSKVIQKGVPISSCRR